MTTPKQSANPLIFWILIAAFTIGVGTYIRLYPLRSHMWSDAQEKATLLVISQAKSSLQQQLAREFPNASPKELNALLEKKFDLVLRQDSHKVRETIQMLSDTLRKNSKESETFYLLESDSYYYYALTQNLIKNGAIGPKQENGKYFEPLMDAPFGYWQPMTYHPYVGLLLFWFLEFFKPGINLMYAVGFTPLLIAALATIAFVGVCRLLQVSLWATWVGGIFLTLAPIFLKRSAYGWYDSDPYNILFPLAILWTFLAGLHRGIVDSKPLRSGIMCAIAITAYALFWHGWGFILAILLLSVGLFFLYQLTQKNKGHAHNLLTFAAAMGLGTVAGTCIVFGPGGFLKLISDAIGELKKFTVHESSLWPDLFIGVGELNKPTFGEIVTYLGGPAFMAIAAVGIGTALMSWAKQKDILTRLKITTLLLFVASTFVITLGAQRFILLTLVPLSLFFAFGVDALLNGLKKLPLRGAVSITTNAIVSASLVLFCFLQSQQVIKTILNPIFNSTWNEALAAIKEKTPTNSIIDSWWPPGHFIKAIAERRVLFDGATLNLGSKGYWLAWALLSQDEQQAVGTLRMLNNSGNQAAEFLIKEGLSTSQAVEIIKAITSKDVASARAFLKPMLSGVQIEILLKLTHQTPAPTYLLIYNELAEKLIGLEFVGKWNFQTMEKHAKDQRIQEKLPARGSGDYIHYLWETMGGAYKVSETLNLLSRENDTLVFEENVFVNTNNFSCIIKSSVYGQGIPQSIIYEDRGQVVEKIQTSANLSYSVLLFKDSSYHAILMDRKLANSLIVKLFYFNGQGLKHFRPLTQSRDLTGRTQIDVFEILYK